MTSISPFRDPTAPGNPLFPRQDWDRAPWNRWTFQHVRDLLPTTKVWRGAGPASLLLADLRDIDVIPFVAEGEAHTIGSFLETSYADGFLVLHGGKIVAEHYLNGMTSHTQHLSQSVAKSVVGTVAGILIGRGVVDPAASLTHYLPELEATAYRGATVQHVLDMTSGVVFDETYTAPDSHMAQLDVASGWKNGQNPNWHKNIWDLVLSLKDLECPHGTSFRYRSIETDVLSFVLERAAATPLAELVSRELWAPMGAEEDAYFTVDAAGYALGDGGFNATLRDYARFALLHLRGGEINGRRIVPSEWIAGTRFGADPKLFGGIYQEVLPAGAYHNQFWIEDTARGVYMARGVFGQLIYIDPVADFAAVVLSSWPEFVSTTRTRTALAAVTAVREALL
ncbi:serine hydrolase domain-containing protein (plasmid) [Rhizobium leguminosarum]|jgi:CubicO group peptidase (beta-lactamase class C family)|uniref:Class C beta-lactamase-related serine hydrolase n=2 Tax=Rhizobium TaxID=379 RepID=A0A7M3DJE7_RHILE|nr:MULTISPECIES: serine hydrolase [Rhizobium]TAU13340.1 class C beta-lactamase-related serine hydrolase [Rhizobium leguminosarum]TAU15561.1 class C beta-lactamase-related serine hydrolase [Rhizobium ruizarguesonis]TAU37040.1 class C beta-lactamase-related serine hydrolase [Rhizobium leguminosarum]TAU37502.1 class C beta-lactamase-related serine hydrolase [Rhizobium ruizarguesonis]TAU46405.1 class C beta-lactamase-related serine hydrolase [Rhizobium ruizarguesonis]